MTDRREFLTLGLMALTACLGTPAIAAESFFLKVKGKVGESYEEMQTKDLFLDAESTGDKQTEKIVLKSTERMHLRTKVDTVKANGNVVTSTTYRSIVKYTTINDKPLFVFNSKHPDIRELAKDDLQGRGLLATLDSTIRTQRDSRGRIVDFEIDSPDKNVAREIGNPFEDEIANGDMLFPPQALEIGQSWDMGPRQFKTSEIGVILYALVGTLVKVGSMDGERMARVDYVGRNPSLEPSDKYASEKLRDFTAEGFFEYSFDRGRITYNENLVKMIVLAREADGQSHKLTVVLRGIVEPPRDTPAKR